MIVLKQKITDKLDENHNFNSEKKMYTFYFHTYKIQAYMECHLKNIFSRTLFNLENREIERKEKKKKAFQEE